MLNDSSDSEASWSIHDIENAPAPPVVETRTRAMSGNNLAGSNSNNISLGEPFRERRRSSSLHGSRNFAESFRRHSASARGLSAIVKGVEDVDDFDYGYETDDLKGSSANTSSGEDEQGRALDEAAIRRADSVSNAFSLMSECLSTGSEFLEERSGPFSKSDATRASRSFSGTSTERLTIYGRKIPRCCSRGQASINTIAVFVVLYAPCFCCIGFKNNAATDKAILGRLNILMSLFTFYQIGLCCFLMAVLYSPTLLDRGIDPGLGTSYKGYTWQADLSSNLWTMNGIIFFTSFFSLILLLSTIMTWRVVRYVDLVGAIRFLCVLKWIVPFMCFGSIALIDYHNVTKVWIKHWWTSVDMAWFRRYSCKPAGTYNSRCVAPIVDNVTEWCVVHYDATDCEEIRNNAQYTTNGYLLGTYYFSSFWCVCITGLLLLSTNTLMHIISKPLVQKSRENNLAAWLTLPLLGCIGLGTVLAFSDVSVVKTDVRSKYSWAGPAFIATGSTFTCLIRGNMCTCLSQRCY
jgi:hypothetical protein